MKKTNNEYTIDPEFGVLAGPYNPALPQEMEWMMNVVEDMKAGNIEYSVKSEGEGYFVYRRGMIVSKRQW